MFSKAAHAYVQSRVASLKHHAVSAFHTGRSILGGVDHMYQALRKIHKATMPVLKDTPLGPGMSQVGNLMSSFEKVRSQAMNAGNVAGEVVSKAKKAAPELF